MLLSLLVLSDFIQSILDPPHQGEELGLELLVGGATVLSLLLANQGEDVRVVVLDFVPIGLRATELPGKQPPENPLLS